MYFCNFSCVWMHTGNCGENRQESSVPTTIFQGAMLVSEHLFLTKNRPAPEKNMANPSWKLIYIDP